MARVVLLAAVCLTAACDGPITIMEIQGDGMRSPLEGRLVTTSGVVTAVRRDGRGFWIQDPAGDGRAETSDALFVFTEQSAAARDRVMVQGTVQEFARDGGLPLTELVDIVSIDVVSTDDQPEPWPLVPLPDTSILDAIAYWSRVESMLVSFDRATVVGPTSRFGETPVVLEAQAGGGDHVFVRSLGDGRVDYNPERILMDDEIREPMRARPGDTMRDVVGVVSYSFGNYKLQPIAAALDARPRTPPSPRLRGGFTLASFNVENLFDDDPGELEKKISTLAPFIVSMLLVPEVVVVQEIEHAGVLTALGDRVNGMASTDYRAVALGSSDGRGIENGMLYDAARVSLSRAFLLEDEAFGPDSASPGREPLVAELVAFGRTLVVIGNHFKSKRGDDPLFGERQPPERPTEVQRKAQARAVRNYVDGLLQEDAGALVVVAGDFNDFPFAEPGEGPDHPIGILENGGLVNVVSALASPYTFIFEGNSQVLDHILVSPALSGRVLGAEIVRAGADELVGVSDHDPPIVRLQLP